MPGPTTLKSKFLLWALLCATAGPAQFAAAEEEVIVTATRIATNLDDVANNVAIIGEDDLQRARLQLGLDEALASVPGLFLQNRYNFAQDLRISIRGFGARASFGIRGVRLLVDGIPVTLPDGQSGVDQVDLGSAGRVEVLRGSASSIYGNAAGGVISIETQRPPEQPFVSARVAHGEDRYGKWQLKTGGRSGAVDYLLNYSDLNYAGYRDHSAAHNHLFNGRVGWQISDTSDLAVSFSSTDQAESFDPGGITLAQAQSDPRSARDRNVEFVAGEAVDQQRLGVRYRRSALGGDLSLRAYAVQRDFQNFLPFTAGGAVNIDREFRGAGVLWSRPFAAAQREHRFAIGVDLDDQRDQRRRFDNLQGTIGPLALDQSEDVQNLGVFAQQQVALAANVGLTLGLRYDRIRFDLGDRFVTDGDDSGARTLTETSPSVGVTWRLDEQTRVFAGWADAFETPTTTEFANPTGGGFNPLLQPQSSTTVEAGVDHRFAGGANLQLSIYDITVDDELIPFELPASPGRTFFQNAGESSRRGAELSAALPMGENWLARLAWTWQDFRFERFVTDNGDDFSGKTAPVSPRHFANLVLDYQHPKGWFGALETRWVDSLYANNANSVAVPGSLVTDMRFGGTLKFGKLTIEPFIGAANLFDEKYFSNIRPNAFGGRYYEPAPARTAYGGVSLTLALY